MLSIWEKVENRWPVFVGSEQRSFGSIRQGMEKFLVSHGVIPQDFSHYGLVVDSIRNHFRVLEEFGGIRTKELKIDWVEVYMVYVMRSMFEGNELEFIEPRGDSFLNKFLKEEREGLHHVGFFVNDIQDCLKKLKLEKVKLIDTEPRSGSHGKISFVLPNLFGQICIELCQKKNELDNVLRSE